MSTGKPFWKEGSLCAGGERAREGRKGPGTGSGCWLVRRAPPRGLRLEELAGEVWGDSAKNKVANYFKVMKDRMQ